MKHGLLSILLVCLLLVAIPAGGQVPAPEDSGPLDQFGAIADRAEAALDAGRLSDAQLDEIRASLEEQRSHLATVEEQARADLVPLREQLAPLVPEDGGETTDPTEAAKRSQLEGFIGALESRLRLAGQAVARANALTDRLNRERRDRFTSTLLKRGPSPVLPERVRSMLASVKFRTRILAREFQTRLSDGRGSIEPDRVALPLVLGVLALLMGVGVRRWLVHGLLGSLGEHPSPARKALIGSGVTLARLVVPGVALTVIYFGLLESGLVGPVLEKLLDTLFFAALIVIGSYALSGAYFAPGARGLRLSDLDDRAASRSHRWLLVLALVLALNQVFVDGGRHIGLTIDALVVLNAALLIVGGLALALFVHHARLGLPEKTRDELIAESEDGVLPPPTLVERSARFARLVARIVAVLAPLLALIGYYGASRYVFYPPVVSGALICLCVLIYDVVAFGSASAAAARARAQGDPEPEPGGTAPGLVPVFVGFLLFMAAVPLLAIIWGADTTDLEAIWTRTLEGFRVGEVRLSPVDFVVAVIVFMVGYMMTRGVQGVLRRSVLPLTRMDQGAQSAVTAGIGYVGVTVAALVSISTAGLDLSNIAIVAGALSVGIGFGLQNIVNNFVSGIILLIERPIKSGDWVEIGGVHGTVQRVNVRSTEIQTFDRSTLFVPNADLISGTVTNWTHGNAMGRLIVPIGVAYGTDARKVEKILLEIARAHPSLLRRPEPYVVFSGFGADSIDFEIRGVLRDVNWILTVASEIRFSIYERFGEEGIEIPFAQRDVYIKNAGEFRGSGGSAPSGD